jgi:hypothetical protein
LRSFTFSEQTPANASGAVYSGRTLLTSFGYAGEAGAGPGIYNFGLNDFSVECWFYLPKPATAEMTLLSSKCEFGAGGDQEVPGASGFLLDLFPAGNSGYEITFTVDSGYGYYQISSAPQPLQDGKWHFIAAVRKNFQLELFLDGQQLKVSTSENNAPNTIALSSNWNLMFGCKNGVNNPEHFNGFLPVNLCPGYLNDAAIWNRALGTAEIQAHLSGGPGPIPANLAGYWTFADGTAMDQMGKAPATISMQPAMTKAPVFYPEAPAGGAGTDQEESLSQVA